MLFSSLDQVVNSEPALRRIVRVESACLVFVAGLLWYCPWTLYYMLECDSLLLACLLGQFSRRNMEGAFSGLILY